jgi:hypothetical protein
MKAESMPITEDTGNETINYILRIHSIANSVHFAELFFENYTSARSRVYAVLGNNIAVIELSDRIEYRSLGGHNLLLATITPTNPAQHTLDV